MTHGEKGATEADKTGRISRIKSFKRMWGPDAKNGLALGSRESGVESAGRKNDNGDWTGGV